MNSKMKYQALVLITVAFTIILVLVCTKSAVIRLTAEKPSALNENWMLSGTDVLVDLPIKIDGGTGEQHVISRQLDESFKVPQTLRIRSSLQNLRVQLDGQTVYSYENAEGNAPFASLWHLVKLPSNSHEKLLTVATDSPFPSMSGRFSEISYGTNGALLLELIEIHGVQFALSSAILILGFVIVMMAFLMGRKRFFELIYLGLFAIFIALWFFSESKMLQFFIGNTTLHGSLAYWMLSLFSVPLILYIREAVVQKTKRFYTFCAILLTANFFVLTTLQLLGIMYYFESIVFTHILMLGSGIMGVTTLFIEAKSYYNTEARHFLYALIIFLSFAVIELVYFYVSDFEMTSGFIKIGLILFLALQTWQSVNHLMTLLKKSYEAEWFEKMAYEDRLTGSKNRMAFELDFERSFGEASTMANMRLAVFDINDLKKINDQYGHVSGDLAIVTGYKCIDEVFGEMGNCYRIGGDEFACLLPNCDDVQFDMLRERFSECLKRYEKDFDFRLNVAVGGVVFDTTKDVTMNAMLHRADQEMYANKRSINVFE